MVDMNLDSAGAGAAAECLSRLGENAGRPLRAMERA